MSYAQRTKLSYANKTECATVVTDGNVVVTAGLCRGQIMKLVDWLILADFERVHEDYIPFEPEPICGICEEPTGYKVLDCSPYFCHHERRKTITPPKSPRPPFQEPLFIKMPKEKPCETCSNEHSPASENCKALNDVHQLKKKYPSTPDIFSIPDF